MAYVVLKDRHPHYDWSGPLADRPLTALDGSTYYDETNSILYLYGSTGWVIHPDQAVSAAVTSLPALVASEAHIGETGKWSDLIVVTPTIAAAAFSANDFVGGKNTLTNAVRVAGGMGQINSLSLTDKSKQNANLLIFIFGTDLAGAYADNAAESISTADMLNRVGLIEVLASDYKTMSNASVVDLSGIGMDVKAASGRNLYFHIVTLDTPTFGDDALQLIFGVGDK